MNRWLIAMLVFSVGWGFLPSAASEDAPHSEKPRTFDIPVWHSDARWELDERDFAHDSNLNAVDLDGPRHEVMWGGHAKRPTLRAGLNGSGNYVFMGYDAERERFHRVTGGAAGYLDGPFARARFHISDYHGFHERALSPDGRFFYFLADFYGQRVRAVDYGEQKVSTLPEQGVVVACGESGKVYLVQGINPPTAVAILSPGPEWKTLETKALTGKVRMQALGSAAAVDEKKGRIYATTYGTEDYYVWYWDLKDGSLHGLLPNDSKKPNARPKGHAGPFEGTCLYNHGEIAWGPDDPEKRFLYVTRVDTHKLYRLDLEKKIVAVFHVKEGRFVDEGAGDGHSAYSTAVHWMEDGSFVGFIPWYNEAPHYRYFKRVK